MIVRQWRLTKEHFPSGVCLATALLVLLGFACSATAEDWPTYRHDHYRSSSTPERLDPAGLSLEWIHTAEQAPRPAWPGPARWDAYVRRQPLSNMRDYDESFHTIVIANRIYYGSSADDAVHCLNAETGEELWRYTTGGPVRIVPTLHEGRLYFGSDDGYAYCIAVESQELVWRHRAGPPRMLVNDGRLISNWPVRTGVLVHEGRAYFAGSLLPWQETYLCAVDAATGEVSESSDDGTFTTIFTGLTLEGAMLATEDHLIATQGRAGPWMFDRTTGESLGRVNGAQGGAFALVTPEGYSYFGPGPKEGFVSETNDTEQISIAKKFGAVAVVAAGTRVFVLERQVLACIERRAAEEGEPATEEWLWRHPTDLRGALILSGDVLYVGGEGAVMAVRSDDGIGLWRAEIEGTAQGLVVANGQLVVSTDRGTIYAFSHDAESAANPATQEPATLPDLGQPPPAPAEPLEMQVPPGIHGGPYVRFLDETTAELIWQSDEAVPTLVEYVAETNSHTPPEPIRITNAEPTHEHRVVFENLEPRTVYRYRLGLNAAGTLSGPLEFDTHFNYSVPRARPGRDRDGDQSLIEEMTGEEFTYLEDQRGIAVLLGGPGDEEPWKLAAALARRSELNIVVLAADLEQAMAARLFLQDTQVYGTRIAVLERPSEDSWKLPSRFAGYVVVFSSALEHMPEHSWRRPDPEEVCNWMQPWGGTIKVHSTSVQGAEWELSLHERHFSVQLPFRGVVSARYDGPLPGIGEWSNQYGTAGNATYTGETLDGANRAEEFEVQWLGRPGPRYQADRQNRKPAPLCVGGLLYIQGLDRVICQNAYNGIILWNLEIPDSRRFNLRNDSANWCANYNGVYLAVRDECWDFIGGSGEHWQTLALPPPEPEVDPASHEGDIAEPVSYEWGFMGMRWDVLVGSATPADSAYQQFWGGQYWYTDPAGDLARNVCSNRLFAYDTDGTLYWQRETAAVPHTAIAIGDANRLGYCVFVESRNEEIVEQLAAGQGRLGGEAFWSDLHLVALNLTTGEEVWQQPLEVGSGETMFSLTAAEGAAIVVASAGGSYRVAVFDLEDGTPRWETTYAWEAVGKGGDSARPAVVEGRLYLSPLAFDLATGEQLEVNLRRGACGSYAAARDVFISRLGDLGLWSPDDNQSTTWTRLRPDCWLSTIPAAGMILSPEAGGGCSCGGWLETSLSFAPRSWRDPAETTEEEPSAAP